MAMNCVAILKELLHYIMTPWFISPSDDSVTSTQTGCLALFLNVAVVRSFPVCPPASRPAGDIQTHTCFVLKGRQVGEKERKKKLKSQMFPRTCSQQDRSCAAPLTSPSPFPKTPITPERQLPSDDITVKCNSSEDREQQPVWDRHSGGHRRTLVSILVH